jgi:hypothetical protein
MATLRGGASAARVNPNEVAVTTLPTLWWQFVIAALLLGITVLCIMFVFLLFDALRRMTDPTSETSAPHVLFAVLLTFGALLGGVLKLVSAGQLVGAVAYAALISASGARQRSCLLVFSSKHRGGRRGGRS